MTVLAEFYRGKEQGEEEAALGWRPQGCYYADVRKGNREWRAWKKGYIAGFDGVLLANLTRNAAYARVSGEE